MRKRKASQNFNLGTLFLFFEKGDNRNFGNNRPITLLSKIYKSF